MLRYCLLFLSIVLLPCTVASQTANAEWSLQMCIDYALKNNLSIKQQQLSSELARASFIQSKAQVLPSFNGNATHDYNFGRIFDFSSGNFTDKQTLTQNFNLSTNVTLFNGLQTYNTIKQNEYNYLSSKSDVEKMRNDISLNVATAFLQILFNQELLEIAKRQHELTKQQTENIKKMVEIGTRAKGDLLDMQAQLASDDLSIANAQNNLDLSYLTLIQLLDLDSAKNFSINKPQLPEPAENILNLSPSSIYSTAIEKQPEIKSALLNQKSFEKALTAAKGGISPRITLNGNYGTRYSQLNKQLSDPANPFSDYIITPFEDQIHQNTYKSVGLTLYVPLFNNLQTYTSINRSKINLLNAKYNVEQTQNQLRKTIEQAYADATAAYKNYKAAQRMEEALKEAFKYAEEKFNVGAISAINLNDSRNKLNKAQSDLLQAKYNYIFKSKVLDFYMGKPLSF